MATYNRLVFSQEVFKERMILLIDEALNEAVNEIQKNEWFRGTVPNYMVSQGYDSYVEITANHLKAWIVEYGQGQEADINRNPYWSEYVKSGLTHEGRQSNPTVLKRGSSDYWSVDFEHNKERHHPHGSEPDGTAVSNALQKALARKPEPFLDDLMQMAWQAFVNAVNTKMQSFNYLGCFIATTEHV